LTRLNDITNELESLDFARACSSGQQLEADQLAALNSALLHELYFASLAETEEN